MHDHAEYQFLGKKTSKVRRKSEEVPKNVTQIIFVMHTLRNSGKFGLEILEADLGNGFPTSRWSLERASTQTDIANPRWYSASHTKASVIQASDVARPNPVDLLLDRREQHRVDGLAMRIFNWGQSSKYCRRCCPIADMYNC